MGAPYAQKYAVVYDWNETTSTWTQTGSKIFGPSVVGVTWFGHSVSLSGDGSRLAVESQNGNGYNTGVTHIVDLDLTDPANPTWTQAVADIFDEASGDSDRTRYHSVSLSHDGSIVAIGSPGNDGTTGNPNDQRGSVRAYDIFQGSTCPTFQCGDGVKFGEEICDGTDLGGQTCLSQGYAGGTLSCADDCASFVTSACLNDSDNDGAVDGDDNCINDANPDQADSDNDGVGDVCDLCTGNDAVGDSDGDGYCDDVDNCVNVFNPEQTDDDGDGIGNACDDEFNGDGLIHTTWKGVLEVSDLSIDETTDLNTLAVDLAADILALLPNVSPSGEITLTVTSIGDTVITPPGRRFLQGSNTAIAYDVEYTLACPSEPSCSSMEATAQSDVATITTTLDGVASGSSVGGYTAQSNNVGEPSTVIITPDLAFRQEKAASAKSTLDTYFAKRWEKLLADHNLDVAETTCADATAAALEASSLATEATNAHGQAVLKEAALKKVYDAAVTASQDTNATPAEKTWKLLNAKSAWDQAVAEMNAADTAKTTASGAETTDKTTACDYATLETAASTANTTYTTAKAAVEDDPLIPAINPATLDFIYEDLDGDLIPNKFDACPTQMGLRKDSPATIPGPQDFCPSGCPELWDTVNDKAIDSDNDGIPDCEDRCPFEVPDGINYNHADHLTYAGFSLEWNGCKDSDGDDIPDKFDACPDQDGGACTSGCPDPGNSRDSDFDGIIDCADRCPATFAVGTADGCPDLDMDGVPDSIDYCMATPGSASFAFDRTLELDGSGNPVAKNLNIFGCPDADADLVPDAVDLCDAPPYPNQGLESDGVKMSGNAVVDKTGCSLDSDNDGVFGGYDQCDGTFHSPVNSEHDPNAIVYTEENAGGDASLLGCAKDTDNDGIVDGIDQCPNEGGFITPSGCPRDSDNDGVSDCISISTVSDCHSTTAVPTDIGSCCTVERDNCNNTPRGATVYKTAAEYLLFHSDLNPQPLPGCSFDSDGDSVDDGVDQCPGTTSTEIALAGSYPSKLTIDMKGCPILSAKMWESTVVDVTTSNSNSANPLIELLFSVDAGLPQVLTARQYETSQMVQVQIMDPTCQNKFDDVTATGDEVLPLTVNMNEKGSFTGQIPFDSIPISVDVQLNPDNYVGSPVWATSALYDVGTVDFCLNFAILSDTLEPVTFTELKTTVMLDMTQGFSVIGTSIERNQAEETTEFIDIEYPLDTCQCDSNDVCVDDNTLDDSFLRQSDSLKLCIRFRDANGLPPAYVEMTDVKTFSCSQGGLIVTPIADFERAGDGGQLTAVTRKNVGAGIDDRMLTIDTRLPAAFFGPDERPVDCTGTIVYSFTEGAAIPTGLNRRGLAEASIIAGSTVQRRTDSLSEASSEFSIDIMLAKVNDGKQSVGIIAAAAVGSVAIVALAGTVAFMKYRSGSKVTVKKRESAVTGDSWSISPTEECFRAEDGFAA